MSVLIFEYQVNFSHFTIFKLGDPRAQYILHALLNSKVAATWNKSRVFNADNCLSLTQADLIAFKMNTKHFKFGSHNSIAQTKRQGHHHLLNRDVLQRASKHSCAC